jgi:hypothetical protein
VKPQRPSPEIKHTPANAQLHIHSQHTNRTHTDIHITQNNAGKTASVYIKMANACIYKVFSELSLALLFSLYSHSLTTTLSLSTK